MLAAIPAGVAAATGGSAAGGSALSSLAGPALSAGGSILGGLIGGSDAKKAVKKQWKYTKEFQKNRMQWAVADAKKAGLHPLFALGSGAGGGSPNFMVGQSPMGSAVSDAAATIGSAISSRPTPTQAALSQAQIESINSQTRRNDAEAALALSQARRVSDEANYRPSVAAGVVDESLAAQANRAKVRVVPSEVKTRSGKDSSVVAGMAPMMRKYEIRPGRYVYGPDADSPAEAFENIVGTLLGAYKTSAEGIPYWLRQWVGQGSTQKRRSRTQRRRQRLRR